jgi:hypothetical protein
MRNRAMLNVKGKMQSYLCTSLIKHYALKTIPNLGTRSECLTSRLGRFISGETCPGIHWLEERVGPRVGVDSKLKRKLSCSFHESNPCSLVVQPIAYSLYRLSYPVLNVMLLKLRKYLKHQWGCRRAKDGKGLHFFATLVYHK